jgi:hypothetical protein
MNNVKVGSLGDDCKVAYVDNGVSYTGFANGNHMIMNTPTTFDITSENPKFLDAEIRFVM